jgi:hypothetical protein
MTTSSRSSPTRAALIGKVLLWVVGIPLLIIVFALAAITRGLFGTRAPDRAEEGHAQPPAIYQPKGPEAPQPIPERHSGGIER